MLEDSAGGEPVDPDDDPDLDDWGDLYDSEDEKDTKKRKVVLYNDLDSSEDSSNPSVENDEADVDAFMDDSSGESGEVGDFEEDEGDLVFAESSNQSPFADASLREDGIPKKRASASKKKAPRKNRKE
jgi:hypothetical protein